jgi:predicted transposase YbfD/YdcC
MRLLEVIKEVSDNRGDNKHYASWNVLYAVIAGMLMGRKDLVSVWRMLIEMKDSERELLGFRSKRFIPSRAQFYLIFDSINYEKLREGLKKVSYRDKNNKHKQISIDGKALRASRHNETKAVHILEAFCNGLKTVIDQEEMKGGENEVGAALRLLDRLDLQGKVVTGDAMFTQPKLANKIVTKGGDYLLAVKDNQADLRGKIEASFEAENIIEKQNSNTISKKKQKPQVRKNRKKRQ